MRSVLLRFFAWAGGQTRDLVDFRLFSVHLAAPKPPQFSSTEALAHRVCVAETLQDFSF